KSAPGICAGAARGAQGAPTRSRGTARVAARGRAAVLHRCVAPRGTGGRARGRARSTGVAGATVRLELIVRGCPRAGASTRLECPLLGRIGGTGLSGRSLSIYVHARR